MKIVNLFVKNSYLVFQGLCHKSAYFLFGFSHWLSVLVNVWEQLNFEFNIVCPLIRSKWQSIGKVRPADGIPTDKLADGWPYCLMLNQRTVATLQQMLNGKLLLKGLSREN